MKKILNLVFSLLFISPIMLAQQTTGVPFNTTYWDVGNSDMEFETYMGQESVLLKSGSISVKDVAFIDGTIEVDINFPDARFFPGVFFRKTGPGNLESFYIRPHQSGNPDATQYTPIFNGLAGWQLYHGEGHGGVLNLEPNTWHRIKINVSGDQADIYFNDMDTPHLIVTDLKRDKKTGEIGVNTGAPVHYANFSYSTEKPQLVERNNATDENETSEGLITSWQLSNLVKDADYQSEVNINTSNLAWTTRNTEDSGTLNIAKYLLRDEGMNTALVKVKIRSDEKTTKELQFGYSDFTWVYVNGQLMYGGRNDFRSRDYRYLGTIGFFDAVYLPLEKGDNEVVFVVSENFGGWGLKAKLSDMSGITIK